MARLNRPQSERKCHEYTTTSARCQERFVRQVQICDGSFGPGYFIVCAPKGPRPCGPDNGAAPRGARRRRRSWSLRGCPWSFNGAAPRGARRPAREAAERESIEMLQWGRAPRGAETRRAAPRPRQELASLGPRPEGRGNRGQRRQRVSRYTRFNGAAPRGARKYRPPHGRGKARSRFNGAAPRGARKCHRAARADKRPDASMGPRPEGRGNMEPEEWAGPYQTLQWGRAPRGAEMPALLAPARGGDPASMGPRPEGRGNRASPT